MRLTLRKARRLESLIANRIKELETATGQQATINIYANPTEQLQAARDAAIEALRITRALIAARFLIRRYVGVANIEYGVNALLTEKEEIHQLHQVWARLAGSPAHPGGEVIEAKVTQQKKAQDQPEVRMYGRITETIQVPYLSALSIDEAKTNELELRRNLVEIEDSIQRINNTETIELPDETVELLQTQRII